jgi:Ca-activated chloride channel family protein
MLWRYDSGARLVVPLIEVAAARTRIAAELAAIEADGGTDIASALSAGFEALQQQITSHGVRRIVLVSDGLDQKRDESQRIAMRAAELGIGVSALGVGLDFDEGYMAGVARSGQGNFGFAENGPQLAQFLAKENELAARTAIENAVAELELAPGLRFVRAFGIEGARVEGGRVRLPLGSIAAGGQRRVVIELRATTRAPGERLFVDGSLSWTARATHGDAAKVRLSRLELTASDDPSAVLASRDAAVWSRCHEVMAAAHQLDAAAAYSRGDRGRALQLSKSSRDLLGEAQDAAPPGARAEIDDKARRYQELDRVYGTAADADGRAAAKRAAEGAAQDLR